MKDDLPTIFAFDSNGNQIYETSLDGADKSNNYIRGISAENGGFAILYSSRPGKQSESEALLLHYDDSCKLKKTVKLKNTGQSLLGPVITSKGECILWNPTELVIFDKDGEIRSCKEASDLELITVASSQGACFAVTDYSKNTLLTIQVFQTPEWLETLKSNYGEEKIIYIGFPNNDNNNGSFFARSEDDLLLAIPAQANNKDAAWQFVNEMFTDSWQENTKGLPIVRAKLNEPFSKLLDKENPVLTQEDALKFMTLIGNTDLFTHYDATISDIILSEAEPFFEGQKTADEVASLITSRVNLYLEEQK